MYVSHAYSFGEILSWWWDGLLNTIREWAPYVEPHSFGCHPPGWWWQFYRPHDWYNHTDEYCYPDHHLVRMWARGVRSLLRIWIEEVGTAARDRAVDAVRGFTGWVQHNYPTFSAWVETIWQRVEPYTWIFADSLSKAVNTLRGWIPYAIRTGKGWLDWIDGNLVRPAVTILNATIDDWADVATDAWNWISSTGDTLEDWYDAAHRWLDDLRRNFSARVKGVLGAAWDWLLGFRADPVGNIAGLWGLDRSEVFEFFDHPLLFLIDRSKGPLRRCEGWLARELWDILDLTIETWRRL